MEFQMSIGEIIREERKAQGMTMKELGVNVGLSEQAISQYELGKREIKFEMLEKIVASLGRTIPSLLDEYNLYDEYIPPQFNGDVDSYEAFKKAVDEDIKREHMPHTNEKAEFLKNYELLNNAGKEKAHGYVKDLSDTPKYLKGADE